MEIASQDPMKDVTLQEILTDAIRYWEPRRMAYNLVLVIVVASVFGWNWPASAERVSADLLQKLFVLAVLANAAYCAAYAIDVAAQWSAFRPTWRRYRWVLFGIGVVFAGILARFIFSGMLGPAV
jgi:hypothetical protein